MKRSVLTLGLIFREEGVREGREGSLEETVHCIGERANELKGHIMFANCVT